MGKGKAVQVGRPRKKKVSPQGGYFAGHCSRKAHLDNSPSAPEHLKEDPTAGSAKRMKEGVEFEDRIGEKIAELYPDTVVLTGDRTVKSKKAREAETLAAMDRGEQFIFNARLPAADGRISEPDCLARVGKTVSSAGKNIYAPVDVKHHQMTARKDFTGVYSISELSNPTLSGATERDLAGKPHQKDLTQLAHYHRHLESLGYAQETPEVWGAIISKEQVLVWSDLAAHVKNIKIDGESVSQSVLSLYDTAFESNLEVASAAVNADEPLAFPEKKTACGECEWRTVCMGELHDSNHITLVQGMTPARAVAHYERGIYAIKDLRKMHVPTARVIDTKITGLVDLVEQARVGLKHGFVTETDSLDSLTFATDRTRDAAIRRLQQADVKNVGDVADLCDKTLVYAQGEPRPSSLADSIDRARVAADGGVFLRRDVDTLITPVADLELHLDMENIPDLDFCTLWGTYLVANTSSVRLSDIAPYQPFAAWDPTDESGEADAYRRLWRWLQTLSTVAEMGGHTFKIYSYSPAEERLMYHLSAKHAGVEGIPSRDDIAALVSSDRWVDLLDVLKAQTIWPTLDMGLKSTAKWTRFSWRSDEASGDNSMAWYEEAVTSEDPEIRSQRRDEYLQYNEDDVRATAHLLEWLRSKSSRKRASRLPSVSTLDGRWDRPRKHSGNTA